MAACLEFGYTCIFSLEILTLARTDSLTIKNLGMRQLTSVI